MGLFSDSYKTYVSSTIYNLAGDSDLRPNIIPVAILGHTLNPKDENLSDALLRANFRSPTSNQRRMYNWANAGNYSDVGMPTGTLGSSKTAPTDVVKTGLETLLTLGSDEHLIVTAATIDDADADYWAEDWVRVNHPGLSDNAWTATYDKPLDKIVISLPEGATEYLSAPADLLWGMDRQKDRHVLYAAYVVVTTNPTTLEVTESSPALYTYRMGSGTVVLDALASTSTNQTEFFPVLPLRIDNAAITDPAYEDEYAAITKAFRKLSSNNSQLDALLTLIDEHENKADMDYASIMFGASLNTEDNASKAYLYTFFENLIASQTSSKQDFELYIAGNRTRNASYLAYQRWLTNNEDSNGYLPDYGVSSPTTFNGRVKPQTSELRLTTPGISHDVRISWNYVNETQHAGNARTFDGDISRIDTLGRLKVGEYWVYSGTDISTEGVDISAAIKDGAYDDISTGSYGRTYIFYQHSRYLYSKLEIVGLIHKNYVYNSTAVTITAAEALADTAESGFLIPLHYPTLKEMGLTKAAQMSTANSYLVINAYKVVTIPWWQKGIFRILLMIAIVVLSVLVNPAGMAAMGGIFGTNLAVGTFLGVTASVTTAVIAGAITNAVAAMVVSSIVSSAAIAAFGEKNGAVIGAIASMFVLNMTASYFQTGSFSFDLSSIIHPDNLLRLTSTASDLYGKWLYGDTLEIQDQMKLDQEEYEAELKKIEKLSEEILGMTNPEIVPILLTNDEHFGESRETFLGRTLLTGSDIAQIQSSLITNYAELTLKLRTSMT